MIPKLNITMTNALIGINTSQGYWNIEQPAADLIIKQPQADLEIQHIPSKLTIDQTQAREDVDLKSLAVRIEEFADKGYREWLNGMARKSQEGRMLMRIQDGRGAIARIAKSRSMGDLKQFGIGWIPSPGSVKIDYLPEEIDINWKTNKPIIESKTNKPILELHPTEVNISLRQYANLEIDFENTRYIGLNYEQSI